MDLAGVKNRHEKSSLTAALDITNSKNRIGSGDRI